jgi:hypothetical protein
MIMAGPATAIGIGGRRGIPLPAASLFSCGDDLLLLLVLVGAEKS